MTGFRDFLARFRPAASPGRAAPSGVPVDRSAELHAELAPPLALLEQAEEEAQAVRERADATAASRRREAERQAEEIVAEARAQAGRVRAHAAEQVLRAAEGEAAALLTEAEREAVAVRDRARNRTPALAEHVLALVREDLAAEETSPLAPADQLAPGPEEPQEGGP
ncbi:hypothetical protein Sipo8835_11115 [Streptomyces ipomoeae]|uniref:Uncharacterized protein n=2 Tax=Streptomyces ipomoeae TaxID=103232 RepID=L1KTI5_9ACTN|nr:hypothetical protein [Streptomyces ipomoeae]EKX64131.1 hypothetical protein STRIP9103_07535 [Streptomyces ipomoeae 91-03]MDX2692085.1 hypothetical protein [Streptomyces ipomoeae]MDX2820412.1 hypothetical protein [Streptomyces ipomoeae]MDX2837460.1 hypothetical protein [Streptomyces ipomoeae]MDX2878467.1 hypothetical protein [Streptomyces ipomoeae]